MPELLYSPRWYRVADLRPRLRPQVLIQRKRWRDQLWYLLTNDAVGNFHRINESAYQFVGRCDGQRTVQEIWDAVVEARGDAAPTQDEILNLLVALHDGELLQFDRTPDIDALFHRQGEARARQTSGRLNPFAFRLPLGDPDRLLARLDRLGRPLFSAPGFWIWMLATLFGVLTAASHGQELMAYGRSRLDSPSFLLLLWCAYPLVKLLHEAGHGMAVRCWGGEVHEAGVALLFLVPAPYVDASAASSFIGRRQRALVGAAGIMVELAIATVALLLWLQTQDGVLRDALFALMLIGSLSTVLFNGNPLLRFDGYYVLCDAFDLPNLAARSASYWSHLLRLHLLRLPSTPPQSGSGETKWLFAYAPLSLVYRLAISITMIAWLSGIWLLLALAAGVYLAVSLLLRPAWRWVTHALASALPGEQMAGARKRLLAAVVLPAILLGVVPLPFNTLAPAVVWLPDQAHLRPEVEGFIAELPVADGQFVSPGTLLVRLKNPDLIAERDKLASRLAGLQAERYRLLLRDPVGAQNQAQLIVRTESELQRAETRLQQLEIRAATHGRLIMPRQIDLPGSFVRQGASLGYVLAEDELMVRAAVAPTDIHLVQSDTRRAFVQLTEAASQTVEAQVRGDMPGATRTLPSAALGDRGGGPFLTDPTDQQGTQLLDPVFLVDLSVSRAMPQHIGERAWVRFEHGYLPLLFQGYRQVRQLFLKQGNVTA